MNIRTIIYGVVCVIALAYLAVANAAGYVPFATSITRAVDHNATHYHK